MSAAISPTSVHDDPPASGATPLARRATRSSWRDPRLIVGIALVAFSVLAGAKLFSSADASVSVWAARDDLGIGSPVGVGDLQARDIRFSDVTDADRYVSAASAPPDGAVLVRPVGAGELLPRAALGTGGMQAMVEVPVAASADAVPSTVRAGSVVDVWVVPKSGTASPARTSLHVFDDVTVVSAPASAGAFGPGSTRQIIIAVEESQDTDLARALAETTGGTVVVTRQS